MDHTVVDSYDALGRPLVKRQLFKTGGNWSPATYRIERTYNRAGGVKRHDYPSQHSVTYNYDVAGRLADDGSNLAFKGNLGDGVERTYAAGIIYSPWGGVSREQYGTNTAVYNKLHYNNRGQLCDVRASNVDQEWSGELGALVNYYSSNLQHCGSGTDNNGNVLMSETIINSYFMQDRYSYDTLNRLTAVDEWQNGATHTGSQQYDYDRWGNRTIKNTSWGVGINTKQFTKDSATNRLGVPAGQSGVMTYDNAGNLINDTYTGAGVREYDAENRMTRAWGGNNQWQSYTYNADGQRTRRKVDNQETWQIYGFGGELHAEYTAESSASNPQKEYGYRNGQLLITAEPLRNVALASNNATVSASSTHSNPPYAYPVSAVNNGDHKGLNAGYGGNWHSSTAGTPRMVIDLTGTLADVKRHDYLPFGEELFAGSGDRTVGLGYAGGDGGRQQFTSKERDLETGLDYFFARYYSSTQGRFISVDPDNAQGKADPAKPQGWNAYSYVTNSPLTLIDPDGRLCLDPDILQRLRNWFWYDRDVTDAQLAEEVKRKRQELKTHLRAMDGHEYTEQEIDGMDILRLLRTYNRYRFGIEAGVARIVPPTPVAPAPAPTRSFVIGKEGDLAKPGALRPGEQRLNLPNQGNPQANWTQNSSVLREAMREGQPIRDVSVNPRTGALRNNTGFLRLERNLLQNHGWQYNTTTRMWHPPGK